MVSVQFSGSIQDRSKLRILILSHVPMQKLPEVVIARSLGSIASTNLIRNIRKFSAKYLWYDLVVKLFEKG